MKKRKFKLFVVFAIIFALMMVSCGGIVLGGMASSTSERPAECTVAQGSLPSRVPAKLGAVFTQAANHYDIQPYVLALVYYNENGYYRDPPPPYGKGKAWPTSYAGARGPMQFMSGTWRAYRNSNPAHRPGNINDLVDAVYASAHYLHAELGVRKNSPFGSTTNLRKGTVAWALAAYNAGPGRIRYGLPYAKRAGKEYYTYFAGAKSSGTTLSATMIEVCNEDRNDNQSGPSAEKPSTSTTTCPSGKPARQIRLGNSKHIKVCNVNGMTVNVRIAAKWDYLVKEAKKDGINLTGGGFRTAAQQIALRKAHCGTSEYAIYRAPSSACSPRTARPGTSLHETALAVDLHHSSSYNSKVHKWMKKHAPPLGIYARVPGEPWHWSLGGH